MTPLEEFIHYEYLIIFKRRLADPNITDKLRRLLTGPLARAQARDVHEKEGAPEDRYPQQTGHEPSARLGAL
jgi:hypothetical protein